MRPSWCAARPAASSGALIGLLIVMKGLPLAYSKDMQEDKEGLFDALETLSLSLAAMTGMVEDLTPDPKRMKAAAGAGYATATDLADWLVRALKMPFREAHHATGRIVALAAARGVAAREAHARGDAERRAAHHRRRLRRARGRALGQKPHLLRRDGARQCAAAGEGVAQAARRAEGRLSGPAGLFWRAARVAAVKRFQRVRRQKVSLRRFFGSPGGPVLRQEIESPAQGIESQSARK